MQATRLHIRLHDGGTWEEVTLNNNIAVKSKSIGQPTPKVSAVSPDGMNGIIDFTDAFGLFYNNRPIAVTLSATSVNDANATASDSFDLFKKKYHGKSVDLSFEDTTPTLYYTGRLSVTADNFAKTFREIKFTVDADPFRYPINKHIATYPIYPAANLLNGSESVTYDASQDFSVETIYSNYTGDSISFKANAVPTNGFMPGVSIKLPVTSGASCAFYAVSRNGYWTIEDANNNYAIVPTNDNGEFVAPSNNIWAHLEANSLRPATFELWFGVNKTSYTVVAGDKQETPIFDALSYDIDVFVNGKKIRLNAGETFNPYIELKSGENLIRALSAGVSQSTFKRFAIEKAVL